MKLRLIATMLVTCTVVLTLGACGTTNSTSNPSSSAGGGKLTIGVSFDIVNDIRNAELDALRKAAEAEGDTITFVAADSDAQRQASQIQDLIQVKKVDALIVIAANNDQIAASVAMANAANVPFIAIDRAISGSGKVAFQITGDPVADGRLAAKEVLAAGKDRVAVQLVGALTDKNALGRRDGFKQELEAGGLKVAAEVPTDWDPAKALDGTANVLQSNPDVNTIFVPSDYLLPSVLSALRTAGRLKPVGEPGHIFLVTIDGDPNGCKAVADKYLDADIVTPIAEFSTRAIEAAHTARVGGSVSPDVLEVAGFALNQANYETKKSNVWGCAK